jgi:hypothetical protein
MLDPERIREFAGVGWPLHTDTDPLLEFSAPKTLYRESAPQILSGNVDERPLVRLRSMLPPPHAPSRGAAGRGCWSRSQGAESWSSPAW